MAWWLTALLRHRRSIVGGFIGSLIWKSPDGQFHPAGWILSILGAMLLLWGYRALVVIDGGGRACRAQRLGR